MMKIMPDLWWQAIKPWRNYRGKRGKTKSSISKHPEIIPVRKMMDNGHKESTESMNNDNNEKWKTSSDTYERIREEEAMQKIRTH